MKIVIQFLIIFKKPLFRIKFFILFHRNNVY